MISTQEGERKMEPNRVAQNITNFREAKEMSQTDLSEATGIERTRLNRIEKGTRKITSDDLAAIAKALDVSPNQILGFDSDDEIAKRKPTFSDLGLPYKGIIPDDVNDMYRAIAETYAKQHNLPQRDE